MEKMFFIRARRYSVLIRRIHEWMRWRSGGFDRVFGCAVRETEGIGSEEKWEYTRVEVKIGPASLSSLYHAHTPRAMIRTYMKFPRRLAMMSEVVGPDLLCPNDLHFLSLGTGWEIAWHRDLWSFSSTYVISAGNSIEESSITNGWRRMMRMLKIAVYGWFEAAIVWVWWSMRTWEMMGFCCEKSD